MNKFRKLALALSFAPIASFAQEAGGTSAIDTVIQDVQGGLEDMIGAVVPAVGGVIVAGLVFWGLRALVRWARTYFGK